MDLIQITLCLTLIFFPIFLLLQLFQKKAPFLSATATQFFIQYFCCYFTLLNLLELWRKGKIAINVIKFLFIIIFRDKVALDVLKLTM